MFSLYFSPEAGRVPRVVYYLVNRRENMASKKARKECRNSALIRQFICGYIIHALDH
jgi:hypothetical protein